MSTTDPRKTTHVPCNCVPALGPDHCHLCITIDDMWAKVVVPEEVEA